ncbi:MAG TPA: HNH endonuclease signature motif containing protein, partial [Candidatus Limnocylindrales bacterium]
LITVSIALLLLTGCAAGTQSAAPPRVATAPSAAAAPTSATLPVDSTPTAEATVGITAQRDPRLYPDPALTPGDELPVTAAQVSVPGYASGVRDVPTSEKAQVFAEYDLSYPQPTGAYECDHFIPLCLGGSNSIENLWPEPAPQFHWKDGLEVHLWHEVQAGTLSLEQAQAQITVDWYASWVAHGRPGAPASEADSSVSTAAAPATKTESTRGLVVEWSASAKRYHLPNCPYVAKIRAASLRKGTVAKARASGKTPCLVCKPPR